MFSSRPHVLLLLLDVTLCSDARLPWVTPRPPRVPQTAGKTQCPHVRMMTQDEERIVEPETKQKEKMS